MLLILSALSAKIKFYLSTTIQQDRNLCFTTLIYHFAGTLCTLTVSSCPIARYSNLGCHEIEAEAKSDFVNTVWDVLWLRTLTLYPGWPVVAKMFSELLANLTLPTPSGCTVFFSMGLL